jgi:HEPN superfamily Apea-like protein
MTNILIPLIWCSYKKLLMLRLPLIMKFILTIIIVSRDNYKEEFKVWARQKGRLVAKEKVEEIYEQFHDILPLLSKKIGERNDFINRIILYRNKLPHGSKTSIKIEDDDLFWQYKNLQLILQLCILSMLAFDNEKIIFG